MITNFTIKNVKGFGEEGRSMDFELKPRKINLLIAPNGFGKTSISTAFAALNGNRLDLKSEFLPIENPIGDPCISLTMDGQTYVADHSKNEIAQVLDVTVIKSGLMATSVIRGATGTHVGEMRIAPIVLRSTIPPVKHLTYSVGEMKRDFGANGKVVINLSQILKEGSFVESILEVKDSLRAFNAKSAKQLVMQVLDEINSLKGWTAERIQSDYTSESFNALCINTHYNEVISMLQRFFQGLSAVGYFTIFWQIWQLLGSQSKIMYSIVNRLEFERLRGFFNSLLAQIDSTNRNIQCHQDNGRLVVTFPKANMISNGQRDLLNLVIQLHQFAFKVQERLSKPDYKALLIIDEVFDYLDDANLIALQAYITKMLELKSDRVYIVLLTHLHESHFQTWVLRKHLNIQYLLPFQISTKPEFRAFLKFREECKTINRTAYSEISNDILHFTPTETIRNLECHWQQRTNLRKQLFAPKKLAEAALVELNNYLSDNQDFDPYAVCLALRLKCERNIWERLSEADRVGFLETDKTREKLKFAEEKDIEVPPIYYMLALVFNGAMHFDQQDKQQLMEQAMAFQLSHPSIWHMCQELFDYQEGIDITLDQIY